MSSVTECCLLAVVRSFLSHARLCKGHGRLETYQLQTMTVLNAYLETEYGWPEVGQVLRIEHTCGSGPTRLVIRMMHYAIPNQS